MGKPLDVVGVAEISKVFEVKRNTAWRWTKLDGFPEPAAELASGPIWHRRDVEQWVRANRPRRTP